MYDSRPAKRSSCLTLYRNKGLRIHNIKDIAPAPPFGKKTSTALLRGFWGNWDGCNRTHVEITVVAIFPCGVKFEDGVYRTAETSMVFFELEAGLVKKEGLVALTGIEPVFRP